MKKIHNIKSRSEYFTFKPLSDGDRKEKRLCVHITCVQETKVVSMRVEEGKQSY